MRKALMIIIIVLGFIALIKAIKPSEEMRVRIIPNSNSKIDLEIKEEVKEIKKEYKELKKEDTSKDSRSDKVHSYIPLYKIKGGKPTGFEDAIRRP